MPCRTCARLATFLQAEVRHTGRVRLRVVPCLRRPFEHPLEAAPVVGGDLFAAGRELTEGIAAPLQKTKDALLIIERNLGKIAPPTLGIADLVGPALAAGLDDERIDEGHLLSAVLEVAVDDLFAGDDLGGAPAEFRKITIARASDVSESCRCLPFLIAIFW